MLRLCHSAGVALFLLYFLSVAPFSAHAQVAPPVDGAFIQDLAEIVAPEDTARIQELASRLLEEHATPVIVLTINSMEDYGGAESSVETFARHQFEAWGNHSAFPYSDNWRRGILLLIAKQDRKARIELGANWRGSLTPPCEGIMRNVIVPAFKEGDFSRGIVEGITALEGMVRADRNRDVGRIFTPAYVPPPAPGTSAPEMLFKVVLMGSGFLALWGLLVYFAAKLGGGTPGTRRRSPGNNSRHSDLLTPGIGALTDMNVGAYSPPSAIDAFTSSSISTSTDFSGSSGDFGGGGGASGSW